MTVGGTGAITTVLGGTPRANILLRSCEIAGAVPRFYAGPALRAGGRGSRPGPPIPWGPSQVYIPYIAWLRG